MYVFDNRLETKLQIFACCSFRKKKIQINCKLFFHFVSYDFKLGWPEVNLQIIKISLEAQRCWNKIAVHLLGVYFVTL